MKKLALLSNINIDPLKNHLQKYKTYDLYSAGFNQWQSELLNTTSALYRFEADFIFLHIDINEFRQDVSELISTIDFYLDVHPTCRFLISNFVPQPFSVDTYIKKEKTEINRELEIFAETKKNIFILDFERLVRLHGYKTLIDDKYWYLGRIRFNNFGFGILSSEINSVLNSVQGKSKKVLVLDLDNTLWGGVLGEESWENIQLSEEGVGRIYKDFQRTIKQLTPQGVILAICSKNNETDVLEAFEKNKEMVLSLDDFAIKKVNWNPKPENILSIAQTLNVGTDSIVLIDDSKMEREFVKHELPDVVVPEFPDDVSKLPAWFIQEVIYPYFAKMELTKEDKDKTEQYKRNTLRETEKQKNGFDHFIKELNIKLDIRIADQSSYKRIAQLTQKTNQFNLSVKRYSETEIEILCNEKKYVALSCGYEDKFGNEGIVGCALFRIDKQKIVIDSFMLSCRVLGRKVETFFMEELIRIAESLSFDCKLVEASYFPTEKNQQVKTFLINDNFTQLNDSLFIKKLQP